MPPVNASVPIIEGWFTTGEQPALLGNRCSKCGTYQFPPTGTWCPNPTCDGEEMTAVPMSRTGTVWSYTDAQYKPPPPFVPRSEPFEPFAIAAVELAEERIVILGQVADGYGVGDLHVGCPVELVVEPLETDGDTDRLVWRWRPVASAGGSPTAEAQR